ncbi:hypothetical protein FRC14_002718 [Serendipita sp. 396]|nr:hypothetical protein FRC14_002718 [Serendipita sp. 396]
MNRKDKIIWECQNGGQLWNTTPEAGYDNTARFPDGICGPGWQSLFTAFIISILVDLAFQMYMFFLNWRFMKRLMRYTEMKGPYGEFFGFFLFYLFQLSYPRNPSFIFGWHPPWLYWGQKAHTNHSTHET